MCRLCFVFASLLGLIPSLAFAQTSAGLTVSLDGNVIENQSNQLILTGTQWREDVTLRFELASRGGLPDLAGTQLQVWSGPQSTDCRAPEARQDPTGGSDCEQAPCRLVATTKISSDTDVSIAAGAMELFGDGGSDNPPSGSVTLTFVGVPEHSCSEPRDDVLVEEYRATFELRTLTIAAPTDVRIVAMDNTLGVSWQAENARATDVFNVYVDAAPGAECGDTLLRSGGDAWEAEGLVGSGGAVTTSRAATTAYDLRVDQLGVQEGAFVAVAIVVEDVQTGERSRLSEVACSQWRGPDSMLDAGTSTAGKSAKSCSASTARAVSGGTSVAWAMLLLGLWLHRRRSSTPSGR